ncbi:MAG: hypothetical protein AAGF25_09650 [Pseudomonadota bacterium]
MNEEKLVKLVALSNFMRWFCLALMIIVIVAGAGVVLLGALTGASWFIDWFATNDQLGGAAFSPDTVGTATRILIVVINGVTLFFTCRGLWFLMKLFSAFAKRDILSLRTSQFLRAAGSSFLVVAIYGVVAQTASILLLTMGNPAGQKQLSIGFGSEQLFAILLAGTLFAIGHVLSIATSIDEENKGFV